MLFAAARAVHNLNIWHINNMMFAVVRAVHDVNNMAHKQHGVCSC